MTLRKRPGYTIIAVLIVVVVLSLAAYRFADSMTSEYAVAVRSSESAESRTAAASGLHYSIAAVCDPATLDGQLSGNPYDKEQFFANQPLAGTQQSRGGLRFSIFTIADSGSGAGESRYSAKYGVSDEAAKLNVNSLIKLDPTGNVLHDALMKLPNMTEEIADAIVDWVDGNDTIRPAGAETAYYSGLPQPYLAKNGPLNSLDELLFVRDVTPFLLFGNDRNRNGKLDPGEEDGNDLSLGWSAYLTVYGRELDADGAGNARINLNPTAFDTFAADLDTALGTEMATFLMYYKLSGATAAIPTGISANLSGASPGTTGAVKAPAASATKTVPGTPAQLAAEVEVMLGKGKAPTKKLTSIFALATLQATLPKAANAPADAPTVVVLSPLSDPAKRAELLPKLLDMTTIRTEFEIPPRVNVNTAPSEVLLALPGMTQAYADAILANRGNLTPGDPTTTTGAWLMTTVGMPPETFRSMEKYVTGRTMTYRIQSVGYFGTGGPVSRVEAVIDTNQGHPRILYFRDLTDLGRGFDLPR